MQTLTLVCLGAVLAPLVGAVAAGLGGRLIGRTGAHVVTILGVAVSFALSCYAFALLMSAKAAGGEYVLNTDLYTWLQSGALKVSIGFLIDELTVTMMLVVTFVSLMVHIYTIGYMHDDPGYQRFFSYISLFTFAMLMLVTANNFLQLFFGWEGVGLVSYLLIGFWYQKDTAIFANLKAFLVNRVGDLGMILGIAAVLALVGSLDFDAVFAKAPQLVGETLQILPGREWSALTVVCVLLFIGAMAKSAQVPLHVWLPDSMEGPTPISALIHAATMVTAGIFLVARMSPLFELSETALNFVLFIGAVTALFMGLLGLVQTDIKRVVAYSTLSQLGYMTVALGVSAYSAAIFHLGTHAFFKALLFLAAGSVIIGLHHEQDMRKMGGLWKHMPITALTAWIGTLALVGFPGFAGFFSKDAIIEAAAASSLPAAGFAHFAVLAGVFVTSLYSFRLLFLVFHGRSRVDHHAAEHLHESPAVVTGPLLLLAVPSVLIGAPLIAPMLFGDYFGSALHVLPQHATLLELGEHFHGALSFALHGFMTPPFWLMLAGAGTAAVFYLLRPQWPATVRHRFSLVHHIFERKYYFDDVNQTVFAGGLRGIGSLLWRVGDVALIDGLAVNGTARTVGRLAAALRRIQTGYLYHYAFAMIIGLAALLGMIWYVSF
ncbi:NADH-quinone oxidoreductase subunit L [Immundisolibacter sp.]|uniref:NADH-quinone oxidoreductase subunit L n=1 Tax=Immundisolibacter sp. TaxID=1934948 RepID=UPI000EC4A0F3|nr:NADH-quinone oxidoreductase subunit L [Gammaproteobacteria bacterium]